MRSPFGSLEKCDRLCDIGEVRSRLVLEMCDRLCNVGEVRSPFDCSGENAIAFVM
ncbi:hypothetical protein [Calothrix sp. NIES-2100]|uniref:hypothetical protein n=1 Tax=Calothrix sp. NIES-2100 TaxID=1954172 RepID=UPI0030DC15E9